MGKFVKAISISVGIGLALCALVLLTVLFIFPSDVVEHAFPNYDSAVAAQAIELYRLPTLLPKSATKIRSIRNLDLNYAVVTFEYGPDFDEFIAAQDKIPGRTAKSLGLRLSDDRFEDRNHLVYMPKVSLYEESKPGTLLVNRVHRVAVYFDF